MILNSTMESSVVVHRMRKMFVHSIIKCVTLKGKPHKTVDITLGVMVLMDWNKAPSPEFPSEKQQKLMNLVQILQKHQLLVTDLEETVVFTVKTSFNTNTGLKPCAHVLKRV